MLSCAGCKAGSGFIRSTEAANPRAEGLLHDQCYQSVVTHDGSMRPCRGREREKLSAADTKH